ncbi:lipopolysaccharide transport periplasmic protein LptA [Sphaerotilus sp.]|uniref:lipopolysaccharide transport periplasmic protein LptA n=1 Tax=Sphaerotilus sp. TaxID=2093942 RepID=UPI0034E1D05B
MLPAVSVLLSRHSGLMLLLAALLAGFGLPVRAEKTDGEQALTFDAGRMVLDGKRKIRTLSGGVEITRGTLVLKAAQIELKETAQGQLATATSADGQVATFRQKREGLDEIVEGQARRIEYDTVTETVRFIDQAQVRVLRGGVPADQVTGQTIVYNHARDVFEVQGGGAAGAAATAAGNAGGRVRGVVTPRKATTSPGTEATNPETPR